MTKKAQITIYLIYFAVAVIIIVLASVLAPLGVLFNTEMYAAGEGIMQRANESISNINDAGVKSSIYNLTEEGFKSIETNIEVNTDIFQYGWIAVVVLTGLVLFLFTRRLVEYGGGFV